MPDGTFGEVVKAKSKEVSSMRLLLYCPHIVGSGYLRSSRVSWQSFQRTGFTVDRRFTATPGKRLLAICRRADGARFSRLRKDAERQGPSLRSWSEGGRSCL